MNVGTLRAALSLRCRDVACNVKNAFGGCFHAARCVPTFVLLLFHPSYDVGTLRATFVWMWDVYELKSPPSSASLSALV